MTEPATLISFAFHSTVPGTQEEIHTNLDNALARFGVTEEARASFGAAIAPYLPPPSAILEVVKVIASAAVHLRQQPPKSQEERKALEGLTGPTLQFFEMVALWLAAELASGVPQPDQLDFDPGESLLSRMYLVLYSSRYRASKLDPGTFDAKAWSVLWQAVQGGSGSFYPLREACQVLCRQLADECNNGSWVLTW